MACYRIRCPLSPHSSVFGTVAGRSAWAGPTWRTVELLQTPDTSRSTTLTSRPSGPVEGQLTRGSFAILISVVANAVGGLVYWIVVARAASTSVVGTSSAMFQTLLFANFVGNVGLPVTIARYAKGSDDQSVNVANWSVLFRIVSAVVGVVVVLLFAQSAGPIERLDVWGPYAGRLVFALGAVGAALSVIVEARLVTLRLWGWVIGRSVFAALARLPLVGIVVLNGSESYSGLLVFAIAVGPVALTGYLGTIALRLTVDKSPKLRPGHIQQSREIANFSLVNWFGLLATQAPLFGIPVIVAFATESREFAAFFIAWSFGAMAFLVPHTISQVALSELGKQGDSGAVAGPDSDPGVANQFMPGSELVNKINSGLRLALLATCFGAVAAWLAAGTIASIYGTGYRSLTFHLPLLAGASISWAYTSMGLTAARAVNRNRLVMALSAIFVVATVGPTLVFVGRFGTSAATWSWLGGSTLTAAVTAVFFWQPIRAAVFR